MAVFPLLLAIDTCGPTGSVALGRVPGRDLEILGQTELAGRTYSAQIIPVLSELLRSAGVSLRDLDGIVVVNGPGSFTGVRIGVSAAKGLAQGSDIPVIALSRLEVLSRKSGIPCVALDAHRGEVYLRLERAGAAPLELLAGKEELARIEPAPFRVAVCEDAAAATVREAWPETQLVVVPPPTAKDTIRIGEGRLVAGATADLATLDGHYLRRSDAEIFGADLVAQQAAAAKAKA